MKKLLNFRKWLTVPDAAEHLSGMFEEPVSEADVLRLALDGHLTLSIHFVRPAFARCGPIVPCEGHKAFKARYRGVNDFSSDSISAVWTDNGEHVLELGDEVVPLTGVWDLPMLRGERMEVERRYQTLKGGAEVHETSLGLPLVCDDAGTACLLQIRLDGSRPKPFFHWSNWGPARNLPPDGVVVVRVDALRKFEDRISEPEKLEEKPLDTRERTSLLIIIAALAKMAKLDLTKPSKAAAAMIAKP